MLQKRAEKFHNTLQTIKQKTPLGPGLVWYPWRTLAQFDILDEFLGGDIEKLRQMIGLAAVLDVGGGDGDTAFFLESEGFRTEVLDYPPTNYNAMRGVKALKQALESPVGIYSTNLDRRPEWPGAGYGLTIMGGVLYHLKNPFLVLEELAARSRHIFLSTRIAEYSPKHQVNYRGNPVAYLVDDLELNNDSTNFWILTESCLKRLMRRSGWDVMHYKVVGGGKKSDPVSPNGDARAYVLAKSRVLSLLKSVELLEGWHHLEFESWRWTGRKFGFRAFLPQAQPSSTFQLRFILPEENQEIRSEIKLTAEINGQKLPSRFFSPGKQVYSERLENLSAGPIEVSFEVDPPLAIAGDIRELGVLVDFSGDPPLMLI